MVSTIILKLVGVLSLFPMLAAASLDNKHVSSLVLITRCINSIDLKESIQCQLDECKEFITFTKCPEGHNTSELNLATKSFFCNSTASPEYTSTIGLISKQACSNNFIQPGGIFRCEYMSDNCWFTFEQCENTSTEMLNFNTKLCQSFVKPENPQSLTHPVDEPKADAAVESSRNAGEVSGHGRCTLIIILNAIILMLIHLYLL